MGDVILAVCPNPALDVTYQVDDATPGTTHRVRSVRWRAGGKGVNVVRVASQLGTAATILGFSAGRSGDQLIAGLDQSGIAHDLVAVDGETRRTLAVVTPTETTMFNEPGPQINPGQWDALASSVRTASEQAGVVTVSGSVPPGTPADGIARLVAASAAPVILDLGGQQLFDALAAGPEVVKPNHEEASQALGVSVDSPSAALHAAQEFVRRGARRCIVTLGEQGLVALDSGGALLVRSTRLVDGNPTGAGDAFTAALADGLIRGTAWRDILRSATATAAAAVACDLAGDFAPDLRRELLEHITIEEVS